MTGTVEWLVFLVLAVVAIGTAAGMLLTMSMYRAALFLMSCFVALAGLFILLEADLLAAIQIMMNVGGMMIMALFMVMQMMDPGGEMMWEMKRTMQLRGPGALSMRMPRHKRGQEGQNGPEGDKERTGAPTEHICPMHPEVRQQGPGTCPKCGMALVPPQADGGQEHETHFTGQGTMRQRQHQQMMMDMAMSTAQLPWAVVVGSASAVVLLILFVDTPWPISGTRPTRDATSMVGELLLSRYMIAFEGAAFLILAGIAGAVILGKREAWSLGAHPRGPQDDKRLYTCSMHSQVRQEGPGQCAICGMELVPVEEGKRS